MAKDFEVKFKIGGALASSFGAAFNGASKTIQNFNKNVDATKKNLKGLQDISKKGLVLAGAGAAALTVPVKLAIDAESAMADFKKVFTGTDKEAQAFQKDFLKMSSETGRSFVDVVKIAAAAAQSGIAKADIKAFTSDAVKMGIAFDISAEEAGQSMAEMRTAFKLTQDGVRELADKINFLGNSTPQAAKKIMEITQRVGPLASLANISAENVAAIGSSMVALEPDVAATAIKKVITSLTAGESASKSMREAYEELGLDVGAVSKSVQKDSTRTMLTVLKSINKLPKHMQAANLSSVFGLEGIGGTSQLVDNMPNLIKNLEAVAAANEAGENGWGGSMLKEYESRSNTTEMALNRARESIKNVGITLGSVFLPTISKAAQKVSEISAKIAEWTEKNPELTKTLLKVATYTVAIVGGLSALSLGLITIVGPIMMVGKSIGGVVMIMGRMFSAAKYLMTALPWLIEIGKWLIGGIWAKAASLIGLVAKAFIFLGRAFLMNPIGLAITAIIAAIYLLYTNWDTVSKFLVTAWEAVKTGFAAGVDWVKTKFGELITWFQSLPSKFAEFGKNMIQGLIDGLGSMVGAVIDKAKNIASSITGAVKNAFQINSPSKVFTQFGEYNMQGLANGMDKTAALPQKVATDAAYGTIPTMPKSGESLAPSARNSGLTLTQYITVGSGDAAEQAKQGAASGAQDMQAAYEQMMSRNKRLSF